MTLASPLSVVSAPTEELSVGIVPTEGMLISCRQISSHHSMSSTYTCIN